MAREVERVAQRLTGIAAFDDGGEIENGKRDHPPNMTRHKPTKKAGRYQELSLREAKQRGNLPHTVRAQLDGECRVARS